MLRSLYSAAAGLLATGLRESVVADNLANAETAGYKARRAALASFAPLSVDRVSPFAAALGAAAGAAISPLGSVASGALVDVTAVDWSPGPLQQSSNPLAVAIDGPGFFAVSTPQGIEYTRGGDFRLDAGGRLTDPAGNPVLDAGLQTIQIPGGQSAGTPSIGASGAVALGGRTIARLGVFAAPTAALTPTGGGRYALTPGTPAPAAAGAALRPGFVELANVDMIGQMASLLEIQQAFASDQRAVQTADQTMNLAITDVGTVS